MTVGLMDQEIRKDVIDAMQSGKPAFATYKKTILGRVLVKFLDPIRMQPQESILKGDPLNPNDEEDWAIKVWSQAEDAYLKRYNKVHFENGSLIPYTAEDQDEVSVNQISDEEIESILQKPFFALKNKLEEFTSPVPVRRFLQMAERMNRPVGTTKYIQEVLSKMEQGTVIEDITHSVTMHL